MTHPEAIEKLANLIWEKAKDAANSPDQWCTRLMARTAATAILENTDIRGLIDEVCGRWNVKTPQGFATDLQSEIINALIKVAE